MKLEANIWGEFPHTHTRARTHTHTPKTRRGTATLISEALSLDSSIDVLSVAGEVRSNGALRFRDSGVEAMGGEGLEMAQCLKSLRFRVLGV